MSDQKNKLSAAARKKRRAEQLKLNAWCWLFIDRKSVV